MHYFSPLTPTVFLERTGGVLPEVIAVREAGRVVRYGELLSRSRRLAMLLTELGVERGDRVGLLADNCQQVIEANFGIPGAGGVIVSLNPWLPTDELLKQLRLVDSDVLIVSHSCLLRHGRNRLSEWGTRLLVVFGGDPSPAEHAGCIQYEAGLAATTEARALDELMVSELDPIVVNFTSGTTGTPKGVVMSHRAAYLHAIGQVLMLDLRRQSQYLWSLPMFHVNGWGHAWANVVVGAGQVIADLPGVNLEEEQRFLEQFADAGITHLAGAPRLLRRLVSISGAGAALRGCTVVTGGAAPSRVLVQQLDAHGASLVHQYGLNETFGPYVVCEEQPDWWREDSELRARLRSRQGVAGIHVGTGLRVVDKNGQRVPADGQSAGEVVMAGNTIALGYFENSEATARAFRDGWFYSGDLAVVHPDGYLEIKDRIKDLIYVETDYGWENISSVEVENVLVQCPGVADAALVGVPANDEGARLIAFIEPSTNAAPTQRALLEFSERHLAAHMRPSRFVLADIPKTATGKTRKDLLLDRALRDLSADRPALHAVSADGQP